MPVSFGKDIHPLFRTIDIDHMRPMNVLLDDYEYMSDPTDDHKSARDVQSFLTGDRKPRMPLTGPFWSAEQLDLYARWMSDGYQP
jgi:hypothetical protein